MSLAQPRIAGIQPGSLVQSQLTVFSGDEMWHESLEVFKSSAAACPAVLLEKQGLLSYPDTERKEEEEDPSSFKNLPEQLSEENTSLSNLFHPFIFSSIKVLISPIPEGFCD